MRAEQSPNAPAPVNSPPARLGLPASALHQVDRSAALARVDSDLGSAEEWKSPIIEYRLSSDWQADWKEEVGHWIETADRHGFRGALVKRVLDQAKRGTRSTDVDPNDERHNDLVQELAPAMVTHYLVGTGWSSPRWEPVTGGDVDVDLQLTTPTGREAFLQVKAPDQPGRIVGHRIIRTPNKGDERDASGELRQEVKMGGEADWKLCDAVDTAASQLPKAGLEAKLIAVCPNRSPLSFPWAPLVSHLLGQTVGGGEVVTLPRSNLGRFWEPGWKHIAGVVVLEFVRPAAGNPRYSCVVLLNPASDVQASPDWFPHARICVLDGKTFHWIGGAPTGGPPWLPDGTVLTEE